MDKKQVLCLVCGICWKLNLSIQNFVFTILLLLYLILTPFFAGLSCWFSRLGKTLFSRVILEGHIFRARLLKPCLEYLVIDSLFGFYLFCFAQFYIFLLDFAGVGKSLFPPLCAQVIYLGFIFFRSIPAREIIWNVSGHHIATSGSFRLFTEILFI